MKSYPTFRETGIAISELGKKISIDNIIPICLELIVHPAYYVSNPIKNLLGYLVRKDIFSKEENVRIEREWSIKKEEIKN